MSLPIIETLYHGTIYQIDKIDVKKGRNNKDFGQVFYMATSKSQAIGMMHKKYREPENLGIQYFVGKQSISDRLIKSFVEIDWS